MKRKSIFSLDVIGYADRLNPELVPTIVPPVFRARDEDLVFMPPFRIVDDHVEAYITGTDANFLRYVEKGCGSSIDPPIPAAPKHTLWIDEQLQPRYEAIEIVREHISAFEQRALVAFKEAEKTGDFDTALTILNDAISMSSHTAILLKAKIYERTGKSELAQILRQAAGEPT